MAYEGHDGSPIARWGQPANAGRSRTMDPNIDLNNMDLNTDPIGGLPALPARLRLGRWLFLSLTRPIASNP